jgi:transposase
MPKPLPLELRRRVVEAYCRDEGSYPAIAKRFRVSEDSVYRWVQLERKANSLNPKSHGGGIPPLIPDDRLHLVREMVAEKPDRTIPEYALEWERRHQCNVKRTTMGRALLRAGLPFKKRPFVLLSGTEMMSKPKKQHSWPKLPKYLPNI